MRYEIKGGSFPVVICQLESGEKMITENGSMVWMSPNMQMETQGGGLGKMFSKAFSGESMFQNHYTARGGAGMIAFGSSFPGQIKAVTIGPGQEMILQKSAFLASEAGVNLSIHFSKKLGAGLFGGEVGALHDAGHPAFHIRMNEHRNQAGLFPQHIVGAAADDDAGLLGGNASDGLRLQVEQLVVGQVIGRGHKAAAQTGRPQ